MAIDYGSGGSDLKAPVARLIDETCGLMGTVVEATTRQATEYNPNGAGEPLFWKNRRQTTEQTNDPVLEYLFLVAVDKGRAYFPVKDAEGNSVKNSRGEVEVERRDLEREDVTFIANSAWSVRAIREAKLNDGDQFKIRRLTEKDAKQVECTLEVTGHVDNPQRYNPEQGSGIDYGEDPFGASADKGAAEEPVAAGVGAGDAVDPF
jgi:hypothetical protein